MREDWKKSGSDPLEENLRSIMSEENRLKMCSLSIKKIYFQYLIVFVYIENASSLKRKMLFTKLCRISSVVTHAMGFM